MRKPKPPANTFLTHLLAQGLADERYAVERYKATGEGDIRPAPSPEGCGRRRRRVTASRRAVREMRPARDELIVCTGLRTRDSGVQYWGAYVIWGHMLRR